MHILNLLDEWMPAGHVSVLCSAVTLLEVVDESIVPHCVLPCAELHGPCMGCSFSFEGMLLEAGIPLRHIAEGKNVAMYRTNIANKQAGPFGGNMVVSMRPLEAADAIRAIQITSRYPSVHGAPIHLGDPTLIGIANLARPDYGDAVEVKPKEIPVFWACGVTPQEALLSARLPLAIAHKAGHMLITDIPNHSLAVL
jgi:uncharacterized protein YcsI (UPF0317 family)